MDNNLNVAMGCLIILLQLVLFYRIFKYKKTLDEKNIQLIQFYLDTKFLCKGLVNSLSISNPSEFCNELIREIKEYYNLEDLIIIDSIKMLYGENNTSLRSGVLRYIQRNIEQISEELNDHKLTQLVISEDGSEYVIYISRLFAHDEGDGLIVCIEHSPALLNKHEKASLENSINLLKTRLVYE